MSLRYLWNKLESQDALEQEAYIKNIFKLFNITPIYPVEDNFKNIPGKESKSKNPLGYLIMHLTPGQLQELIPPYLIELLGYRPFETRDAQLIDIVKEVVKNVQNMKPYVFFPFKSNYNDRLDVFNFGRRKYSDWSFLELCPYTLIPAMFRHLYKYFNVTENDEETGISHLAHAECNARMIQLIIMKYMKEDDNGS